MTKQFAALALFVASLSYSNSALSWGLRGHDLICQSAAIMTQEKGLNNFLRSRLAQMGHLCNIPDTHWRNLKPEQTELGNPTHFIDYEVSGVPLKDISTDFSKLVTEFQGKENAFKKGTKLVNFHKEFGSAWWRVEQFFDLSVKAGKEAKFFDMYSAMGLMGHFVADLAMPFHSSADYDGYATGNGGIHRYLEDDLVVQYDEKLPVEVVAMAKTLRNSKEIKEILKATSQVDRMKMLSELSLKDMPQVLKLDTVLKKSEKSVTVDGVEKKTPAERTPAEKMTGKFKPLLVKELARATIILSSLWDQAYVEAGKPDLTTYKSFQYPLTPDFIAPSYVK